MSRRTDKVARSIQVNLAELINYHLNDPRVEGIITVTSVTVSDDLNFARAGITALNADPANLRNLVRALTAAAPKLRRLLTDRIDMRRVPELRFHIDEQALHTRRTLEAIAQAMTQVRPVAAESSPEAAPGGAADEPASPAQDNAEPKDEADTSSQENSQP